MEHQGSYALTREDQLYEQQRKAYSESIFEHLPLDEIETDLEEIRESMQGTSPEIPYFSPYFLIPLDTKMCQDPAVDMGPGMSVQEPIRKKEQRLKKNRDTRVFSKPDHHHEFYPGVFQSSVFRVYGSGDPGMSELLRFFPGDHEPDWYNLPEGSRRRERVVERCVIPPSPHNPQWRIIVRRTEYLDDIHSQAPLEGRARKTRSQIVTYDPETKRAEFEDLGSDFDVLLGGEERRKRLHEVVVQAASAELAECIFGQPEEDAWVEASDSATYTAIPRFIRKQLVEDGLWDEDQKTVCDGATALIIHNTDRVRIVVRDTHGAVHEYVETPDNVFKFTITPENQMRMLPLRRSSDEREMAFQRTKAPLLSASAHGSRVAEQQVLVVVDSRSKDVIRLEGLADMEEDYQPLFIEEPEGGDEFRDRLNSYGSLPEGKRPAREKTDRTSRVALIEDTAFYPCRPQLSDDLKYDESARIFITQKAGEVVSPYTTGLEALLFYISSEDYVEMTRSEFECMVLDCYYKVHFGNPRGIDIDDNKGTIVREGILHQKYLGGEEERFVLRDLIYQALEQRQRRLEESALKEVQQKLVDIIDRRAKGASPTA